MINFIVNPQSGKGRGAKFIKKIAKYCFRNNIIFSTHLTSGKGHATKITKALIKNNATIVVAVGGDGTFHEVLNGIDSFENVTLGFIPCGRGNDFARAANISNNPITALKCIIRGHKKYIDYIDVSGVRCLNVAGTGIDISVLERSGGKSGKITYIKSLIYCLKNFTPYKIDYTTSGETHSAECMMIGVCNGTSIGSNIKISPYSRINDGLLNVVVISLPENGRIFPILPKCLKGKHIEMPITKHILCEEIDIKVVDGQAIQLDGEIYPSLPFSCKIVKNGIATFTTYK